MLLNSYHVFLYMYGYYQLCLFVISFELNIMICYCLVVYTA